MSKKKDSREIALKEEKIPQLIMRMSAPAVVAMMVMSVYNVVDALFMGMLGTEALGAATIGYPYFMLLTALGLMFGMGGASYQSRLLGEQRMDMAEKTVATVFVSGAILGILTSILTGPFPETIARLFGATGVLLDVSADYIWILSLGAIFPVVSMCANNLLRAEGSAMHSLVGMGLGSVINIALDPLLMFTFDMGVKGAALATVISQAIGMFILLSYYFRHKTLVKLHLRQFAPSIKMYVEILKVGGAAFLQQLLISVVMAITNMVAGTLGGVHSVEAIVAAVGAVNRVSMLGFATMIGFGQGLQPVIGYNYGARKYSRVREAITFAFQVSIVFGTALGMISLFFPMALAELFSNSQEVLIPTAAGIRFLGFAWPFAGLFFVTQVLFQALGRSRQAITLAIARQLFNILCVFILSALFGVMGLMSALMASLLSATLLAVALYIPYHMELRNLLKEGKKTPAWPETEEGVEA